MASERTEPEASSFVPPRGARQRHGSIDRLGVPEITGRLARERATQVLKAPRSPEPSAGGRSASTRLKSAVIMPCVAVALLIGGAVVAGPGDSSASTAGSLVGNVQAGSGIHLSSLNGRTFGIRGAIHVLTFGGPHLSVQIALAHHAVDGGRQTPVTMCRATVGCVAAINADYFDLTRRGIPDPGDAVGGIVQNCVLLHTPEISHQQADLDNQTVSQGLNWGAAIDAGGVIVPITAVNQELPMSYANVHVPLAGTLLYSAPYALALPTGANRLTDEFTYAQGLPLPTTINTTTPLEYVGQTESPVRVGPGRVDVSVEVGSPLASLQVGQAVTLTTTSTSGCDNIGGHPVLINHGVPVPVSPTDTYMTKPYARTVIGWTSSGDTVIVVVDGKDGVSGATAAQLTKVLESLNVVTALNLDGGVSSTLYAEGRVVNRPTHRRPRSVSTALLVVRS